VGFFDETIDSAWLLSADESPASAPQWWSPPTNAIPGIASVCIPLVREADLALWMSGARVYSDGFALELHIRWCHPRRLYPPFIPGRQGRGGLCLGFQATNGARALLQESHAVASKPPPGTSVLVATRAFHGYGAATVDLWMCPMPPDGLTWIVEWRAQRVRELRIPFDVGGIAKARDSVETLWPAAGSESAAVAVSRSGPE
jgi:hypothetical protein